MESDHHQAEYRCPGQADPIGRAVHLGRLAAFYPACRQCPHRDDVGPISSRQRKRLAQAQRWAKPGPLFGEEGLAGVCWNDFGPADARRVAAAFGVWLRDQRPKTAVPAPVVIAGDGRPRGCELIAAAAEGLAWSGWSVVDIGAASAACVAFAVEHLAAAGGLLLGNPDGQAHTTGMKFWAERGRPLSAGGPLEAIQALCARGTDRPTRKSGSLARCQAEPLYLAVLQPHFHALRPLRFLLESTSGPLVGCLQKLLGEVACQVILGRVTPDRLTPPVPQDALHFAARIDDDGERCRLWDESGRPVAPERLLLLLARQPSVRAVVLEETAARALVGEIRASGARVHWSDPRRAAMHRAMQEQRAFLGGGPSGRFWHGDAEDHAAADALMTLTLLLGLLSQSDRPLSEVLDAADSAE